MSDGAALKTWIEDVARELDGLDIVVANVSGFGVTPDDDGWHKSYTVDIMGTVHAIEAAMPFLEASDAASVVAIASVGRLGKFWGYIGGGAALRCDESGTDHLCIAAQ